MADTKKKSRYRVGQVVWCAQCGRNRRVSAKRYLEEFGIWFYRLGTEKFTSTEGGHTDSELSRRKREKGKD